MIYHSGLLEWDSNFFGKKIAFIDATTATERKIIEEINRWKGMADCVYLHTRRPVQLDRFDIVLADKKRTYLLERPEYKELPNCDFCIPPLYHGNPAQLYNLAFQAGEYSRFRVDPHFSEHEFHRFYETWINNSLNAAFADYVLVALDPDPQGLITSKIKGDCISVGLFAVSQEHRGKGFGSRLMQETINIAAKKNLKVSVSTQADNLKACMFYEHKGFQLADERNIYHVWLPKKA